MRFRPPLNLLLQGLPIWLLMYKIITFSKRKPDLALEEFRKYWLEVHGQMILEKVPDNIKARIKKYSQCPAVYIPGNPQPYDGVAEFCFEDFDSLRAWSKFYFSDEAKDLREDQARFVDVGSMVTIIAEEKVVIGETF